jgi:hypothetical protein
MREWNAAKFHSKQFKGRDWFGYVSIYEMIILKSFLKEQGLMVRTGFDSRGTGSSHWGALCQHDNESLVSSKCDTFLECYIRKNDSSLWS